MGGGGGGGRFAGTRGANDNVPVVFGPDTLYAEMNTGTLTDARSAAANAAPMRDTLKKLSNAVKYIKRVSGRRVKKNIELTADVVDLIDAFANKKYEGKARKGVAESWIKIGEGLKDGLPKIVDGVIDGAPKILKGLQDGWPEIVKGVKKLPKAVWDGITKKK